jgi:hypothetical protein
MTKTMYHVTVTKKKTGETFEGTVNHDGLADVYAVALADGTVRFASVLDTVVWRKA